MDKIVLILLLSIFLLIGCSFSSVDGYFFNARQNNQQRGARMLASTSPGAYSGGGLPSSYAHLYSNNDGGAVYRVNSEAAARSSLVGSRAAPAVGGNNNANVRKRRHHHQQSPQQGGGYGVRNMQRFGKNKKRL
jgi:hypothetical protein